MIKLSLLFLLIMSASEAYAQHCGLCFYGYQYSVIVPTDSQGKFIEGLTIIIKSGDKLVITNKHLLKNYPLIDSSTYRLAYSFYKGFAADTSHLNLPFLYTENRTLSTVEELTDQYKTMFYVDHNLSLYHSSCYYIYFKTHILTPPADAIVVINDPYMRYKTLQIPLKNINKIMLHDRLEKIDEIHPSLVRLKRL